MNKGTFNPSNDNTKAPVYNFYETNNWDIKNSDAAAIADLKQYVEQRDRTEAKRVIGASRDSELRKRRP